MMEDKTNWHLQSLEDVWRRIQSSPSGLSNGEAAARLAKFGPNELKEKHARGPWKILWEQFTATMVLILIAAGVVSALLGKWQEASAIFAIVLLFGLLGFFQEYRAEKAMAALKKLATPQVRVQREGRVHEISARDLVPGDVVLLEAGNFVPADLRLTESINLRIQEAALTGESDAVEKSTHTLERADLPLGDRVNMAYMGTTVTYGRGVGVVVATGMQTELGNIANLLQRAEDESTPLQKRLDRLGRLLAVVGVIVAALLALFEIVRGAPWADAFLLAVSVAVAVVPEGLPAVVTITLAMGARRMLARNALIRKLPAVETLGSVTTICSDKTGTLTENRMTVTVLDVAGYRIEVSEETDQRGHGVVELNAEALTTPKGSLSLLLIGGALCNDARLQMVDGSGGKKLYAIGDPTEGALVVAAAKFGIMKADLERHMPRVGELPFDSERKRMTTLHNLEHSEHSAIQELLKAVAPRATHISFTKGSVDGLLDVSTHVWENGARHPLTTEYRTRIEAANRSLAENGMRVLGVAFKTYEQLGSATALETGLTIVGFVGIIDPPRAEVKEAVAQAKSAGIRPVMITGDHPLTALHIARELGIADDKSRAMTGAELDKLNDEQLRQLVEQIAVFARVSPEHKLRIVNALQARGHVVAMTGDGVNDAPALKTADIGVAMGVTGTDVSKEAATMVLQDDNFKTIVAAVEEGRVIYDNLRKFVKFSIGGNVGKILVMLAGVLIGLPAPLLPLQLLWLNLLTDGLLGMGLGLEPAERNVMKRKPIAPNAGIFSDGVGGQVIRFGVLIGALSLGIGAWRYFAGYESWQTIMFTTLAFAQVWQAIGIRSGNDSIFKVGLLSNKPLFGLAAAVVVAQMAAIYVPTLQDYLKTTALTLPELFLSIGISALVLVYAELEKLFANQR
ncbi:MAG: ATPase [Chloroflexota bacterium]|nr:cation-translocating P-type ATPase [Caldilinea sp.]GIK76045.1 MAG: ATPase [Chloroflexota bacterium]